MAVKKATTTEDANPADEVKYVKVTSPAGVESTVPESIVDALLESGYSKTK